MNEIAQKISGRPKTRSVVNSRTHTDDKIDSLSNYFRLGDSGKIRGESPRGNDLNAVPEVVRSSETCLTTPARGRLMIRLRHLRPALLAAVFCPVVLASLAWSQPDDRLKKVA